MNLLRILFYKLHLCTLVWIIDCGDEYHLRVRRSFGDRKWVNLYSRHVTLLPNGLTKGYPSRTKWEYTHNECTCQQGDV